MKHKLLSQPTRLADVSFDELNELDDVDDLQARDIDLRRKRAFQQMFR